MPTNLPCPNPVCTQVFNAEAVQGASSFVCPRCGTKFEFRPPAAAKPPAAPVRTAAPKPPAAPAKTAALPARPVARPAVKAPIPAAKVVSPRPAPVARPVAATARATPPPLPAKPAAVPPPLAATVLAPAVPMAMPLTAAPAAPSNLDFQSTPHVVVTPRRRRSLPGWLVAAFIIVPVFGGVAGLVLFATHAGYTFWNVATPGTALSEAQAKGFVQQGNFRITPPPAPWKQDAGLQVQMQVDLAYRRANPGNAMALAFKDYQKRLPRDAELIDEALGKLHVYLGNVEYEVKPKDEPATLGGRPALALEFTGEDPEHVLVEGECLATAARGFGYWFFTWGPQDDHDNLKDGWAALRDGFALGKLREGWTEAPRKTLTAVGDKPPYKLDYAEEVWQKQDLDGYDKAAETVLLGRDPKDKDVPTVALMAKAQVLALDRAPDLAAAVKEARDYLLEMEKEKQPDGQYTYAGATMDVVTDKSLPNPDADVKVGSFPGHVVKLEVKKATDLEKYVVLAVARTDDNVLAVVCECAWERRGYWDQEFTPLLEKLRPSKGK